ncbi:hypothetical protein [Sessilibacter corallicola]|uniref:Uncharacterized protein n=1 Tax=Sessilibacter corallicola TaxID=2904075 RepID=A0ABQ0A932_9GAMM
MKKGAITLAEGSQDKRYKTDATLVLNGIEERQFVLRTSYDPISIWKTKYAVGMSPFYPRLRGTIKEAALIDNEVWVFGVDGTKAEHIIEAVKVAMQYYKAKPDDILSNVYIKNLNVEDESRYKLDFLVKLNKELYKATVQALKAATSHFGILNEIFIHVYSANTNQKIPAESLHSAMKAGGAHSVQTDPRKITYKSGNNLGTEFQKIRTNMHVARLNIV